MFNKIIGLTLFLSLSWTALGGSLALAQVTAPGRTNIVTTPLVKCPNSDKVECVALENPLEKNFDIPTVIGIVIRVALSVVGSLALLILVWGGYLWLTSAGNAERVQKGTQAMLWAGIGLFLVFASYIIVSTFTGYLTGS